MVAKSRLTRLLKHNKIIGSCVFPFLLNMFHFMKGIWAKHMIWMVKYYDYQLRRLPEPKKKENRITKELWHHANKNSEEYVKTLLHQTVKRRLKSMMTKTLCNMMTVMTQRRQWWLGCHNKNKSTPVMKTDLHCSTLHQVCPHCAPVRACFHYSSLSQWVWLWKKRWKAPPFPFLSTSQKTEINFIYWTVLPWLAA